jgi:hypothetical protein
MTTSATTNTLRGMNTIGGPGQYRSLADQQDGRERVECGMYVAWNYDARDVEIDAPVARSHNRSTIMAFAIPPPSHSVCRP